MHDDDRNLRCRVKPLSTSPPTSVPRSSRSSASTPRASSRRSRSNGMPRRSFRARRWHAAANSGSAASTSARTWAAPALSRLDAAADRRGARDGRPLGRRLHHDPQHGGVDDRHLRHRVAAPGVAPAPRRHDRLRGVLPHRAGCGIGCRRHHHERDPLGRRLRADGRQAVHLGRGRSIRLCRHGAHGRAGRPRHHGVPRARRDSRAVVRGQGAEDGLEGPAHPPGDPRRGARPGGEHRWASRGRGSRSRWRPSTAGA